MRRLPSHGHASTATSKARPGDWGRIRDDAGLLRTAETAFVWQRSENGWTDIVELLATMEDGACHQYLGGPRDDVQVMASIGEYGEEWWNRHGN